MIKDFKHLGIPIKDPTLTIFFKPAIEHEKMVSSPEIKLLYVRTIDDKLVSAEAVFSVAGRNKNSDDFKVLKVEYMEGSEHYLKIMSTNQFVETFKNKIPTKAYMFNPKRDDYVSNSISRERERVSKIAAENKFIEMGESKTILKHFIENFSMPDLAMLVGIAKVSKVDLSLNFTTVKYALSYLKSFCSNTNQKIIEKIEKKMIEKTDEVKPLWYDDELVKPIIN